MFIFQRAPKLNIGPANEVWLLWTLWKSVSETVKIFVVVVVKSSDSCHFFFFCIRQEAENCY